MKFKILSLFILILALLTFACACDRQNTPEEPAECVHIESEWITDVAATLEDEGAKHTVCTECGITMNVGVIPALSLTEDEILTKLRASVVKVICYDYDGVTVISQGSGFFIDTDGTFITNSHVVRNCYFVKIENHLGAIYDADTLYSYNTTVSDYAILKAILPIESTAVEFSTKVTEGETVYALGYPNSTEEIKITSGELKDDDTEKNGKHYYLNTAFIDHGSSGGILANGKGKVIGITTGSLGEDKYVALRYKDFKFGVEAARDEGIAPGEYFHNVDKIQLDSENVNIYYEFDVYTSASGNEITYWLAVKLKDEYKDATIALKSSSVTVTMEIVTDFTCVDISNGGAVIKVDTDTQYLSFSFNTVADMLEGCQEQTLSTAELESIESISYSINLVGAEGEIHFYDLND